MVAEPEPGTLLAAPTDGVRRLVGADPSAAAELAAQRIAAGLQLGTAAQGSATVAMSGGSTAPLLVDALLDTMPPSSWSSITVFQVDERVAPDGHPARNVEHLVPLQEAGAALLPMPVAETDLPAAARRYADLLPASLDVVHLGVGDDGHTASWPPTPHPDADVPTRAGSVAVVHDFNGRDRMTLTLAPVAGARARVVFATGAGKAAVIAQVLDRAAVGLPSEDELRALPARRLPTAHTTLVVDRAVVAPH